MDRSHCPRALVYLYADVGELSGSDNTLMSNIRLIRTRCPNWEVRVTLRVKSVKIWNSVLLQERHIRMHVAQLKKRLCKGQFMCLLDDSLHLHDKIGDTLHISKKQLKELTNFDHFIVVSSKTRLESIAGLFTSLNHRTAQTVISGAASQLSNNVSIHANTDPNVEQFADKSPVMSYQSSFVLGNKAFAVLKTEFAKWYFARVGEVLNGCLHNRYRDYFSLDLLELTWCGAAAIWRVDKGIVSQNHALVACKDDWVYSAPSPDEMQAYGREKQARAFEDCLAVPDLHLWRVLSPTKKFMSAGVRSPSRSVGMQVQSIVRGQLGRAIISSNVPLCERQLADAQIHCIPAVFDEQPPCGLSWDELVSFFSPALAATLQAPKYGFRKRFEIFRNLAETPGTAAKIYAAHVHALETLCSEHRKTGITHAIVFEEDANLTSFHQILEELHVDLLSELLVYPDVTSFNLAPSQSICTPSAHYRRQAYFNSQKFAMHDFDSWGAVAVGYNLDMTCRHEFLRSQRLLRQCIPSDLGLYNTAGQIALDATLPFFLVQNDKITSSTHSADGIHAQLRRTNIQADMLWQGEGNQLRSAAIRRSFIRRMCKQ